MKQTVRKNIVWAVVIVASALLQMTWLDKIQIQSVRPDLILLFVVYFAVAEGEERAMFTGALGGVFQDVAGDVVLGHHVFCNVLVGYLIGRISRRLVLEHPVVKVGLVLMASLFQGTLYTCIQYIQTPDMQALRTIMTNVIPGAFYTCFVTPLVFYMANWIFVRRTEEIAQGAA